MPTELRIILRLENEAAAPSNQWISLLPGNFLTGWDWDQADNDLGAFPVTLCTPKGPLEQVYS